MRRFAVLLVFALVGCGGGSNTTTAPKADPDVIDPELGQRKPTPPDPTPPSTATITGAITHPARTGEMLAVGYVEITGTEFVSDVAGMSWLGPDTDAFVDSTTHTPRVSSLRFERGSAKYELTGLPQGTYVVYASVRGGPTTWSKVTVKAGDQLARDLILAAGKGGTVEVTVPADFAGEVKLGPSDLAPADDPNFVVGRVASDLGLGAKADKGKATVKDVPPGKYTLFAIPGVLSPRGTVEVKAGETAMAEIKDVK